MKNEKWCYHIREVCSLWRYMYNASSNNRLDFFPVLSEACRLNGSECRGHYGLDYMVYPFSYPGCLTIASGHL